MHMAPLRNPDLWTITLLQECPVPGGSPVVSSDSDHGSVLCRVRTHTGGLSEKIVMLQRRSEISRPSNVSGKCKPDAVSWALATILCSEAVCS